MQFLIVAATNKETSTLRPHFKADYLETGIGMVNTAYALAKRLSSKKYDLIIHIGICGSYRDQFPVGTVVEIGEEIFGDLGATAEHGEFMDLRAMGFSLFENGTEPVFNAIVNPSTISGIFGDSTLPIVRGVSLNTTTGHRARIDQLVKTFNPDVETMEGGAVALVCLREQVPYLEIRSVSNRVEPRNKANWNVELALSNLAKALRQILS